MGVRSSTLVADRWTAEVRLIVTFLVVQVAVRTGLDMGTSISCHVAVVKS